MESDEIYEVTVKLPPTAITFLKGHRIRVVVGSANWPRFEANPNTDRRRLIGPKTRVAKNQVYHDPDHRSAIALPVIESRKGSRP
jgi:putative CocE/NonD family hydrolase